MSSRRGSRKKSRRGNTLFARRPLATVALGLAASAGACWLLFGGSTAAQGGIVVPGGVHAPVASAENPAEQEAPTAAPVPKGPTLEEVREHIRRTRSGIGPLTGSARYVAIREAMLKTTAMLEGPMAPEVRGELLPLFNEITDVIFFSEYRNEFASTHVVKRGDVMQSIASSYGVTEELICLWNNIEFNKRHRISENQTFKIVSGKPRIVVDKEQFTLSFYFGELLARQYIIAHGVGNSTPIGAVTVTSKVEHPDKQPHAGPMQREMAERWIGLSSFDENGVRRDGIGIHGTKYEDSIPGESSHGCVRMFNKDVVELYAWVRRGMSVEIKG